MRQKNNRVVFQDDYLLVIDKPSGLTVNRAATTRGQATVEDQLPPSSLPRRGIVHRLDKDTSGLLIIAKTQTALTKLQAQFKNRQVTKAYLVLVHGRVEPNSGEINLPVARNPLNRHRFAVEITGRQAVTGYRVISASADYSFLEAYPRTGRTHQIRVHFKHLNHPLVADPFYAGKKRIKSDRSWCPRLFLHSHKISFTHPQTGKIINLESSLPDDLQTALKKIPLA
ncbi:MAG: RluA family pseudouridine synthase [Patescibacteria group bacterium]|nr:RluA family pseudouridine synthase [Patescibacteria group bacterium]